MPAWTWLAPRSAVAFETGISIGIGAGPGRPGTRAAASGRAGNSAAFGDCLLYPRARPVRLRLAVIVWLYLGAIARS